MSEYQSTAMMSLCAVCLRMQVDPEDMSGKTERAFTEYALAMCVLFLAALNYVG